MNKSQAINLLENGMDANYGYGNGELIEEFFAKFTTDCHEISLIPHLKRLTKFGAVTYQDYKDFDDNGAGGPPHPTDKGTDFTEEALNAIQVIRANFAKLSPMAQKLYTEDAKELELVLDEIINSNFTNSDLIPILENIVETDVYFIQNSEKKGFKALENFIKLGEKAIMAIYKIEENQQGFNT